MTTLANKIAQRLPRRAAIAASVLALLANPACLMKSDDKGSTSNASGGGSSTSTEASTSGSASGGGTGSGSGGATSSGTSTTTSTTGSNTTTSSTGTGGGGCAAPPTSSCASNKTILSPPIDTSWGSDYPAALVAADMNGDGKDDLVVTGPGVRVFLSNGDGTFAAPISTEESPGTNPSLAAGDFNHDCKQDLVLGSFNTGSVDDNVDFLAGKGDGTFAQPAGTSIATSNLFNLSVADFNGDGKLDYIFDGQDGGPYVVLNNGQGFAGPGVAVSVRGAYAAGDIDGDGSAEIVYAGSDINNQDATTMCVLSNSGNAQFGAPVCYPMTNGTDPQWVKIVDLNGDGKPDIVAGGGLNDFDNSSAANVFINKGDGTFADHVNYPLSPITSNMLVVDIDNDGRPDIAFRSSYSSAFVAVFKNKGDGSFETTPEQYPLGSSGGSSVEQFVSGDFKGNGLQGFAAFNYTTSSISVITGDCKP